MTDNCPRCCTSTEPQDPADDPQRYICRSCGHSWTTNRLEATYTPPEAPYALHDDPDAWEAEDPHEPWWHDQDQDQDQPPTHHNLIAKILARENHTTYTVERTDDPAK